MTKTTMTKHGFGTFFSAIHDYLEVYLTKQRNLSEHTLNSYRVTLNQLVTFVENFNKVPLLDITFEMLTSETITAFLDCLEKEHGNSISTRNTRLAAIKAFVKYTTDRNIAYAAIGEELKKVTAKKPNKIETIEYMSMDAITAIVEQIDLSDLHGLRDRTIIVLLYDTAARVSELVGIKLKDIKFGRTPIITVFGKNKKIRSIPIMESTVQHLKKYLLEYHSGTPGISDSPLFYSKIHGEAYPLTDRRIRYLLKNYADKARQKCLEVPENVHPHMIRHSRAMHLYQNGMDLTLISEWLGHAFIETTKVYAHADTEHKRTAIAKATPDSSPLFPRLNSERFTISDDETLKRLIGLRK